VPILSHATPNNGMAKNYFQLTQKQPGKIFLTVRILLFFNRW
jgi:hypothetical protein